MVYRGASLMADTTKGRRRMLGEPKQYWRSVVGVTVVTLLLTSGLVGGKPGRALARPQGYTFTPVAFLDDPAPGGGTFTFDFEPYGMNSRGEVAFAADLTTGGEGVFIGRRGQLSQLARSGQPAPGGGIFATSTIANDLGRVALNDP